MAQEPFVIPNMSSSKIPPDTKMGFTRQFIAKAMKDGVLAVFPPNEPFTLLADLFVIVKTVPLRILHIRGADNDEYLVHFNTSACNQSITFFYLNRRFILDWSMDGVRI